MIEASLAVAERRRKWAIFLELGSRFLLPKDSLRECEEWFQEIGNKGKESPYVGTCEQGKFLWEGGSAKPSRGRLEFFLGMVKTTANSTWLYSKAPGVAGIEILWRISPSRYPYCEAIGRHLRVERNGAPGYLE